MHMEKVITLQPARVNGKDIPANEIVEIDGSLAKTWYKLGIAKQYVEEPSRNTEPDKNEGPPKKDGDKNETKIDNVAGNRTNKPGRGKTKAKS